MHCLKVFILVVICLEVGLSSASQDVKTSLKEISERLERTNKMIDSILWQSDDEIDSMTREIKYTLLGSAVADSLSKLLNHTSKFLIRLRNELNSADTSGDKLDVAQNLLLKTPKGDSLYNYMMQVYEAGVKYGDSTSRQRYILSRKYDKAKWLDQYFKMVPTFAAITILSKFRNDLVLLKSSLLAGYIQELKNRILSEAQQ